MIQCKTKVFKFRDGSCLLLSESNWHISGVLDRLQAEAREKPPLDDPALQNFRVGIYPTLVACVIEGQAPSEEECLLIPDTEILRWHNAVKEINPHWFGLAPVEPEDEGAKKNTEGS